jgi:hypothetical protein
MGCHPKPSTSRISLASRPLTAGGQWRVGASATCGCRAADFLPTDHRGKSEEHVQDGTTCLLRQQPARSRNPRGIIRGWDWTSSTWLLFFPLMGQWAWVRRFLLRLRLSQVRDDNLGGNSFCIKKLALFFATQKIKIFFWSSVLFCIFLITFINFMTNSVKYDEK